MSAVTGHVRRLDLDRWTLLRWGIVLNVELAAILAYLLLADVRVTDPWILVYPLVWINVGLWAVATARVPAAGRRARIAAGTVAIGYFVLLTGVGGVVSPGHALHGHAHATGFRLVAASLPPGWGPALFYGGSYVSLAMLPYQVIGYAALAYLVFVTLLDAAGSAVTAVVGLFSCVSCTWPVLGTVVAGLLGSGSVVATAASSQPYGLSTLVFLSAVALLRWRPFGR